MKLILVLASIFLTAHAEGELDKMSFCYTVPNTETALSSQSAFVSYPGLSGEGEITLKIFKDESEVHSYTIPETDKNSAKIYKFALDGAAEGGYTSQLCRGNDCSYRSAPATQMDIGKQTNGNNHELTCTRNKGQGQTEELKAELKPITGTASGKYFNQLKQNDASVYKKNGFTKIGDVKEVKGQKMAYFAVTYPAGDFREWVKTNDKCRRKYIPAILTYIIETNTKRVVAHGRLSPNMPFSYYSEFLGLNGQMDAKGNFDDAEGYVGSNPLPEVPIELLVNVENVNSGSYTVWHSACMMRKDGIEAGITHCATPFVEQWSYPTE